MSFSKIAIVGAGGNVGPSILKALLGAGFEVTILSRESSNSTDSLASHPNQKIVKVNMDDVDSIAAALKGIEGVVSNVTSHALLSQKKIIDGAIAAGVKRFIPSDFGADMSLEINKTVPFNAPKAEIHRYIQEKQKSNPDFTYTFVTNGPFFDWCLQRGVFGDLKKHEITLWDGGDTRVSVTTLAAVGQTVVGVFRNAEATKNKYISVAEATITQKELMEITKSVDGQEWTTKPGSTQEIYQTALDELKKPEVNHMVAVMGQLFRILFCAEYGPDLEGKLDNDLVGLPRLSNEQVKEIVKSCL